MAPDVFEHLLVDAKGPEVDYADRVLPDRRERRDTQTPNNARVDWTCLSEHVARTSASSTVPGEVLDSIGGGR